MSRVSMVVVACIAIGVGGCGQAGRTVGAEVGSATTPSRSGGVVEGREMPVRHRHAVRPGVRVLLSDSIGLIRGRRVGLLTNQTGVDEHGESDIDRMRGAEATAAGAKLVTLFSPEHGIRGTEDRENLASGIDARSGLVVHSLYTSAT